MLRAPSSSPTNRASGAPAGCMLLVFGLAFSLPGLALSILLFHLNLSSIQQSGWERTDATLLELPKRNPGSEKPIESFSYRYRFAGRTLTIEDGNDWLPGFKSTDLFDDWYRVARKAKSANQPMPVWVDPHHPERHALIRSVISPWIYFFTLFTFSHGLLGLVFLTGWRHSRAKPNGPPGEARASPRLHPTLPWVTLVLLLNGIVWPSLNLLLIPGPDEVERPWLSPSPPWLAPLALLIGAVAIWRLIRSLRRRSLARSLTVHYPADGLMPGTPQRIEIRRNQAGTLLPPALIVGSRWHLQRQEHLQTEGSTRSLPLDALQKIDFEVTESGASRLVLSAELPLSAPASSDTTQWTLHSRLSNGWKIGPFVIPVSQPPEAPLTAADDASIPLHDFDAVLTAESITRTQLPDDTEEFTFAPNRLHSLTTIPCVFSVIGFVASVVIWNVADSPAAELGAAAALLIGIGTLLIAIHCFTNATRLRLSRDQLEVIRTSRLRHHRAAHALSQIDSFQPYSHTAVNGQPLFHLRAHLHGPTSHKAITPLFRHYASAESFTRHLAQRCKKTFRPGVVHDSGD